MAAKNIEAAFILLFKIPFLLLKILFKNKILLILAVIIVGFFVIRGRMDNGSKVQLPVYQQNAPSVQIAPQVLPTSSLLYYVKSGVDDGKTITLKNYYYYDLKKKVWINSIRPLPLEKRVYGDIKLINR